MPTDPNAPSRRRQRRRYNIQLSDTAAAVLEGLADQRGETFNDIVSDGVGLLAAVHQGLSEGAELHLVKPGDQTSTRLIVTGYSKLSPSWTSDRNIASWEEGQAVSDQNSVPPEVKTLILKWLTDLTASANKDAFAAAAAAGPEELAANAHAIPGTPGRARRKRAGV